MPAELPELAERHRAWVARLGKLGVPHADSTGVLLALGPIAVRHGDLEAALDSLCLELVGGVVRRGAHAGWNARARLPRTVSSQLLPGSIMLVRRPAGGSALRALAVLEERGLGPGRPDGWGRLAACHPIHLELSQEE